MNEEIKENGLVESENKNKDYVFSWRKLCAWLALFFSVSLPIAAIGLGIMCLSSVTEDEKKEVSVLSYISIGVAVFLTLYDFVLKAILL